jgi:hypothetical protein
MANPSSKLLGYYRSSTSRTKLPLQFAIQEKGGDDLLPYRHRRSSVIEVTEA